jgi:hypothetical protein
MTAQTLQSTLRLRVVPPVPGSSSDAGHGSARPAHDVTADSTRADDVILLLAVQILRLKLSTNVRIDRLPGSRRIVTIVPARWPAVGRRRRAGPGRGFCCL